MITSIIFQHKETLACREDKCRPCDYYKGKQNVSQFSYSSYFPSDVFSGVPLSSGRILNCAVTIILLSLPAVTLPYIFYHFSSLIPSVLSTGPHPVTYLAHNLLFPCDNFILPSFSLSQTLQYNLFKVTSTFEDFF